MERKKLDANKGPVNKYRGGGGGGGPEQRGGGSPRFQPSQWGGSGYFEPHKGVGHHILSLSVHLRSANQHISSSLLQSISHITPEYFPILFQPINRYDSL